MKSESSSGLVFEGSGSGVIVLDPSADDPSSSDVVAILRPLGLVRDIVLTAQHVYIAASKQGIVRFNRTDWNPDWFYDDVASAWAAEVVHLSSTLDLIVAGTNDGDTGMLHLFVANPLTTAQPTPIASLPFDRPIYTMASWLDGTNWVVLVGTACGTVSSGGMPPVVEEAALWRFDFDVSGGPPTAIPTPSATWAATDPSTSQNVPTFVRDIVIDPEEETAYAACQSLGIHKFDLSNGALDEQTNGGWPITKSHQVERFTGLALHKPTAGEVLLAGTLGPLPIGESQYWGPCSVTVGCDSPEENRNPGFLGLRLWDVTGTPTLLAELSAANSYPQNPLKVSVRAGGSDDFLLDVADGPYGLQVVAAARSGSWGLENVGALNDADDVVTTNSNDAVLLGDNLVASHENAVTAFDATLTPGGSGLLATTLALEQAGAILLSKLEGTSGYAPMVFGSIFDRGATFIQPILDGNGKITSLENLGVMFPIDPMTQLPTFSGRCLSTYCLQPEETPDGKPWLMLISLADSETVMGCGQGVAPNGSLKLYRLNDDAGVVQPTGDGMTTGPVLLGSWVPSACASGQQNRHGFLMDATMYRLDTNQYAVWATYGPKNTETGAGLLVLRATYSPTADEVTFTFIQKVEAFSNVTGGDAARICYPTGIHGTLLAAFGCSGLAAFDVNSPLSVTVDSSDIWVATDGASVFDVSANSEAGFFYAAIMNKGIGQFSSYDISAGPTVPLITTPFQPISLVPAPSSVYGQPAYFVSDGSAGTQHLQILQE